MVVKHIICTDPSQNWNTSLEFFPGVVWELHAALCGKLCLALQPAKISLTTPGASCILPDGQRFFSSGFRLTQQRWHTPIYMTHHGAVSLHSVSFEWLLSHKCDTVTFFKRSGRERSIFINLWNRDLAISEWFVSVVPGTHCYLQPQKTPVPGTWCKTPCHGLASHHAFAGMPKARYAEDSMRYPGALLTPCQGQAGRSCWGRCLPTSPSRSPAEQWLSSRGEEVWMKSQSKSTVRSWNLSLA